MLLTLFMIHIQHGTKAHDSVRLHCPQGVDVHYTHDMVHRMISPSSLFLLQQPIRNLRSFLHFSRFFTDRQTDRPSIKDVNDCVRHYAADGMLSRAGLIEDGSRALLGLASCQDRATDFGWGLSKLQNLYQSFQDWKRWRLAALVCEQLQARDGVSSQQRDMGGHSYVNPLEGLKGGVGYRWFLVDPRIFSTAGVVSHP